MFTGLFVEAIGCATMHFLQSLTDGGIYGNFSAMGHVGYFVKIDRHRTSGRFKRAGSR